MIASGHGDNPFGDFNRELAVTFVRASKMLAILVFGTHEQRAAVRAFLDGRLTQDERNRLFRSLGLPEEGS